MLQSWQLRSTGGDSRDSGAGLLGCASLAHLVDQHQSRWGCHRQAATDDPSHWVRDGGGKATQCTNSSHGGSQRVALVRSCLVFLCSTQGSCARQSAHRHGRPAQSAHNAFCALHNSLTSTWPRQSASGSLYGCSWSAHRWFARDDLSDVQVCLSWGTATTRASGWRHLGGGV